MDTSVDRSAALHMGVNPEAKSLEDVSETPWKNVLYEQAGMLLSIRTGKEYLFRHGQGNFPQKS